MSKKGVPEIMVFPQLGCPSSASLKKKKYFFAVEGQDGTGKQTQATALVEALKKNGLRVLKVATPAYGSKACYLLERWRNKELDVGNEYAIASLYAHDRLAVALDLVAPALLADSDYDGVVADRWTASNIAHCGGRILNGHETQVKEFEKFLAWVTQFEHDLLGIQRPINLVLDVSAENSERLARARATDMDKVENTVVAMKQAKTVYDLMCVRDPNSYWKIKCQSDDGKLLPQEKITGNLFDRVVNYMWGIE